MKELIEKAIPILEAHRVRNKLHRKVIATAYQLLLYMFRKGELSDNLDRDVANAIEMAMIYYANCLGEEV